MTDYINYLNQNAGAIQALLAFLLVLITAYYAWQTRETVRTMKEAEERRNRPRMLVYVEQREEWLNFVDLVIANMGPEIARNVSFELVNDLDLEQGKKLSEIPFIQNGFKIFLSGRIVRRFIVSLIGTLDRLQTSQTKIIVRYTDGSEKNHFSESFELDFSGLIDRQLGNSPAYKISENLEKISVSLQKIERKIK